MRGRAMSQWVPVGRWGSITVYAKQLNTEIWLVEAYIASYPLKRWKEHYVKSFDHLVARVEKKVAAKLMKKVEALYSPPKIKV